MKIACVRCARYIDMIIYLIFPLLQTLLPSLGIRDILLLVLHHFLLYLKEQILFWSSNIHPFNIVHFLMVSAHPVPPSSLSCLNPKIFISLGKSLIRVGNFPHSPYSLLSLSSS